MSDAELLQEYVSSASEAAFRTLVERHLPLVFSAARRQVGDAALAEDVSQVVFMILARKAHRLSTRTILAGWLFQTTRYTAARAVRAEQRRRRREQEGLTVDHTETNEVWERLAPCLDAAMAQLGEVERNAILLRYFQNKRIHEVGLSLGLSESAAEKRISRGIARLRKLLLKRGVVLPVVVIPGLLMSHAAQAAPSYLGAAVTSAALGQLSLSTSAFILLQQASRESVWPKLGMALSVAAVLALITGLTVHFWPTPKAQDPFEVSFQSRIVARVRPAPQAPSLNPVPPLQPTVTAAAAPVSTAPDPQVVDVRPPQILSNRPAAMMPPAVAQDRLRQNPVPGSPARQAEAAAQYSAARAHGIAVAPYPTGYPLSWVTVPSLGQTQGVPCLVIDPLLMQQLREEAWRQQQFARRRSQPWMPAMRQGDAVRSVYPAPTPGKRVQ